MNKCKHCRYWRDPAALHPKGRWCSNSQSDRFDLYVGSDHGCAQFERKGKAPLLKRLFTFIKKDYESRRSNGN